MLRMHSHLIILSSHGYWHRTLFVRRPDPLIGYHNVTEVVVGAQYPERDSNLDV